MYSGFRFVGELESIREQRALQRAVIEGLLERYHKQQAALLDVGIGDGHELDHILGSSVVSDRLGRIVVIDIDDWFLPQLRDLANASKIADRIEFVLGRAEHLLHVIDEPCFDIVHCGFLHHELEFGTPKRQALSSCYEVLVPGGSLVYADAFLDNAPSPIPDVETARRAEVGALYRQYIQEAQDARQSGDLSEMGCRELCGESTGPGLMQSMDAAVRGEDDFHEPLGRCVDRLITAGFVNLRLYPNPCNKWLYTIVAQKPL